MSTATDSPNRLYNIRMRASGKRNGKSVHVSGAERLAPADAIADLAQILAARALEHAKGTPDAINIRIEAVAGPCLSLPSLPARAFACATAEEGLALAARLLAKSGVARAAEILALLPHAANMRGAILLDVDSLERLEPDHDRGVRVTCMDEEWTGERSCLHKEHYREAIILATKAAHAPGIVGEICVSDDPDYVTGYVASRELGYVRLQTMKNSGNPVGGRIFLYRGKREDLASTLDYLEHTPVLVTGISHAPSFVAPGADCHD